MSLNLDRSGWSRVVFGDVATNINDYFVTDRDGTLPYVAGPHIMPGHVTVAAYGSTGDDDFPPTFKRKFLSGDVLLHSRGIEKLAVVDRPGVTGEKLFVLRSRGESRLLQRFVPWLLMGPHAQRHMQDNFTGSVNKFLNWRPLASFEFDLPPLDEQKRIADLLWAIECHKLALGDSLRSARETLARVTSTRLNAMPTAARLGDLATIRSGPSFAAADVHDTPVPESIPVLGIPNTKPNGTVDLEGAGYVTGLPRTVGRIDNSSLILIRTNGNRQRIGNVYLPPAEAHGHAVSAFQFLMHVSDPEDREYLYWFLNEESMQARMSDGASGTVGLGNLAVRWLNEQPVPWSTNRRDRMAVVDELQHLSRALRVFQAEFAATNSLSTSILTEIFGGN